MNGSELLEQIEGNIEYSKSSYASVVVAADMDSVKEIQPSNGTYGRNWKASGKIDITVTERSGYQFIKWMVEPAGSARYINGTDAESKSISLEILDAGKPITIVPFCAEKPTVSFEPERGSSGNKKNAPVTVRFSKPMEITGGCRTADAKAEENFAGDITIQCSGSDYSVYFEPGVVGEDKKNVVFYPKTDTLIPAFTEAKLINVIVPGTFYYDIEVSGEKVHVPIGEDVQNSYGIVSETEDYVTIVPQVQSGTGDLSFNASKTYYLGEEASCTFTPSAGYEITGWTLTYQEDGKVIDSGLIEAKEDAEKKSISLTIKSGTKKEVILEPVCSQKGTLGITISSKKCKVFAK